MMNEVKNVNINVTPGYRQNTAGDLIPDILGNQINIGGESIQNCWIDYPRIPSIGDHIGIGISQSTLWPLQEYTRWRCTPEGSYYSYKLDLAGVSLDSDFSLDVDNGRLSCHWKRFDANLRGYDTIQLKDTNGIDFENITATFRACVLEVKVPFLRKGVTKINVKPIEE